MRKHGWKWASEKALDAYKLILVDSAFCKDSFGASEHFSSFIDLADDIVRLEGRIPDSFAVAVELGAIYSAAAVNNAHDVRTCDEFIAKANEAWRIASTHLENGVPRDPALSSPGRFGPLISADMEDTMRNRLRAIPPDILHRSQPSACIEEVLGASEAGEAKPPNTARYR